MIVLKKRIGLLLKSACIASSSLSMFCWRDIITSRTINARARPPTDPLRRPPIGAWPGLNSQGLPMRSLLSVSEVSIMRLCLTTEWRAKDLERLVAASFRAERLSNAGAGIPRAEQAG